MTQTQTGAAESEAAELTIQISQLDAGGAALTATGNLFQSTVNRGQAGAIVTDGINGAINLVIQKSGTGTVTITPESSFDGGVTWKTNHPGYQQTDGQATLTRATGAFSVGAGAQTPILQLLDPAPLMRFVATVTGTVSIDNAFLYLVP